MTFDIAKMRRSAEEGSCPSQCMLGLCYLYGIDVEINYKEAFRFLSAAAQQRSSRAVLNLGRMYAQGLGIQKNVAEAIRHFEAVAGPSDSSDAFAARIELARVFARGLAGPANKTLALQWYSSAIDIAAPEDDPDDVKEAREYVSTQNR
jgi:uncharacterized protein